MLRHRVILWVRYSCGEDGDVEQVARTSKQFSHVCDFSSLSLSLNTLVFINLACFYTCGHLLHAWYYLCLIDILAWVIWYLILLLLLILYMLDIVFVLTLVYNQESYSSTSTLSLEESWGESTEYFTENSASLFDYTLCVSVIVLVCIISFNSAFVWH